MLIVFVVYATASLVAKKPKKGSRVDSKGDILNTVRFDKLTAGRHSNCVLLAQARS